MFKPILTKDEEIELLKLQNEQLKKEMVINECYEKLSKAHAEKLIFLKENSERVSYDVKNN